MRNFQILRKTYFSLYKCVDQRTEFLISHLMKSNAIRLMACDLNFSKKFYNMLVCYVVSYLIQFCITFNYLQPTLYHINCTTQCFSILLSRVFILGMLHTHFIHNNIYFNITVNLFEAEAVLPFVDAAYRKLVSYILCCWYWITKIYKCQYLKEWCVSVVVNHLFWNL